MRKQNAKAQIYLILFFIVICILIIIPFIMLVSISFSNEKEIALQGYNILPRGFDLSAYEYIFNNPSSILNAYKITIIFSVVGTFLSVLFMSMIAYPISVKELRGRRVITFYLYFTMLFGGGLVPTYILITRYLHLQDTIWVYILPSLISPWFVFMIRTFFQGLPGEIAESAKMDGANQFVILFRMIIPLSKPVLATIAVMTFLGKWNEWYTSMLYINNDDMVSLQYLLQKIMQNIKMLQNASADLSVSSMLSSAEIPTETIRMAMAVVVAGPALVIFPFFQKYFVQGLTVGSVKG